MKGNYRIQISGITEALNIFGKSTGEYYLFYEFSTDRIRFSENIGMADDLFSVKNTGCTLAEWRKGVDPRDIYRLEKVMESLISRKTCSYNLNYRVKNSRGQNHWINSKGRAYYGEDGSPLYVLGQLSSGDRPVHAGACGSSELKKEIKKFMEAGKDGCLLIFGVDNLKAINLRKGRSFGDAVLNDVSRVMKDELCRRKVFRINGDCFAANVEMLPGEEAEMLFKKVQRRLTGQCTVSGGCVPYRIYPAEDEGTFLQYGEMALDYSKIHGKNRLTFFSVEMYEEKLKALELKEDLIRSIEAGFEGFEVYYQAQVRSGTYEIYGAEALLRYRSPRRGDVSPVELIPVLEQSGLICKVGLWVLEEALRACRKWREKIPDFHISVNVSDVQLEQDSVEEDVLDRVCRSGVPGSALTLEITESMKLTDYLYLNRLFLGWQQRGIEIAVDDFGTGYSSLSCLKEMAINELKIDRCFVREIQNSAYNYRLLSNIIELASMCPFRVCCEGVETAEELAVLEELHPTLFQGYLFAEPCSGEEFEAFYIEACADGLSQLPVRQDKMRVQGIAEKSEDRKALSNQKGRENAAE